MPFEFEETAIPGVVVVRPRAFGDDRGFFVETYKQSDFAGAGIAGRFVQDNHSRSSRGVLRGLHFQKDPKAQGKLVRCVGGAIFDVAVDIRKGSPSYARWVGMELSEQNGLMLYVPPGFAHGFLTLSEKADVIYKCTEEYAAELDRGVIWNDPEIGIDWPVATPLLSSKDGRLPLLSHADNNFVFDGSGHQKL
jgi:dTDP-4-dehydrorhamnose 3,5-epimerase